MAAKNTGANGRLGFAVSSAITFSLAAAVYAIVRDYQKPLGQSPGTLQEEAMLQGIFGMVLLMCGAAGLFYLDRRKFYRRNVAGLEEFSGYGKMVITKLFERAIRIVSVLSLMAGITVVAVTLMRN